MIWITQWLCPARHCSIALAWDDQETDARSIERRGEEIYKSGIANRYCGICKEKLHLEHGRTCFKTMEDATPHLLADQEGNKMARRILSRRN